MSKMKTKIIFSLLLIAFICCLSQCRKKNPDSIEGCTDPNSLNHNSDSAQDMGSCKYAPSDSVG